MNACYVDEGVGSVWWVAITLLLTRLLLYCTGPKKECVLWCSVLFDGILFLFHSIVERLWKGRNGEERVDRPSPPADWIFAWFVSWQLNVREDWFENDLSLNSSCRALAASIVRIRGEEMNVKRIECILSDESVCLSWYRLAILRYECILIKTFCLFVVDSKWYTV